MPPAPTRNEITDAAQRQAILRRIGELVASPPLVHPVDHHVERLIDLDDRVSTTG